MSPKMALDVPRHRVGHGGAAALVRDVNQLDAGRVPEQLRGQVRDAADAGRGVS